MPNTLKVWKKAKQHLADTNKALCDAGEALEDAGKAHREKHPLSDRARSQIIAAYRDGRPLCCEGGRRTLAEFDLDEHWREYVNDWAYEYIGCNDFFRPGGSHYKEGLREVCDFVNKSS